MKAILDFDLPDDEIEFRHAINSKKYHSALWELNQWFREIYKYQERNEVPIEEIRNRFFEIVEENGIADDF